MSVQLARPVRRTAPAQVLGGTRRGTSYTVRGLDLIWLALAAGLLAGLVETALVFGSLAIFGAGALGTLQMNRHALWMIAAADTGIIGVAGIAFAAVYRIWPRRLVAKAALWVCLGLGLFSLLQMIRQLTLLSTIMLAAGLAACVVRRVDLGRAGFWKVVRRGALAMGGVAVFLAGLHFAAEAVREHRHTAQLGPSRSNAPNVVLIVLDTVRADALSCYGYPRLTTPTLDRLAARGMRFVNARSPGAWTLPSHASMFTGRWPHELSVGVEQPLDARFPTIAEHMAANGYSTAGFVANTFFCNAWFGLDRGFGRYEDTAVTPQTILRSSHLGRKLFRSIGNAPHERPSAHFNRKSAATINTEFLAWLDGRSSEPRPFFAFLNYFDAHDPYMLPHHELPSFAKAPRSAHDIRLLRDWNLLSAKKLTPTQIAMARDCYDDCLRQLDLELGRLVDQLDRRGVLQTTWLIVTSDHGEQFGEHGQIGHGNAVQRETVHVPLLIIPPKQSDRTAQVITQPVSLRNVPATVVAVAGLSESASPFPGSALVPTTEAVADELVMSELTDPEGPQPPGWRPARSVVADGFVYIQQSDGREQLFDLASDPDEKHDLATLPAHATTLEQFRARVRGR